MAWHAVTIACQNKAFDHTISLLVEVRPIGRASNLGVPRIRGFGRRAASSQAEYRS